MVNQSSGSPNLKEKVLIRTLGTLSLSRSGAELELPASKKTRALLAYLCVTERPHRRERLCELFWDIPDDPRGALRWSLSKLRAILKPSGDTWIVADRERAHVAPDMFELDLSIIRRQVLDDSDALPTQQLRDMAAQLSQPFLSGLDISNQPEYQSWLMAERDEVQSIWSKVMHLIVTHPDVDANESLVWTRRWLEQEPLNQTAAEARLLALRGSGQLEEANTFIQEFELLLESSGVKPSAGLDNTKQTTTILSEENSQKSSLRRQSIRFCQTTDNVRIAYATVGRGLPIVKAANWLNHLELDWNSPIWGDLFQALAADRNFVRYDERGNGLSDWDVKEISQEKFVQDLEAVIDQLQLEKFPLLGISQGCAVSIEYAVRHPERVSGLILISGYASGWRIGSSAEEQERREAVMTLTKHGWGGKNPAYRRIFSQTFMPDANADQLNWFDEFQRQTTSPENAVRFQSAFADIDVRALLAKVKVPTIVFHARDDQRISLEQGREVADGIPNARFVELESKNHIILGQEPAWDVMMREIRSFLEEHRI